MTPTKTAPACRWAHGGLLVLALAGGAPGAETSKVTAPPASVVKAFKLAPFYKKYVSAGGLPVLSSAKVSDAALREAAYLIDRMLHRRFLRGIRFVEQRLGPRRVLGRRCATCSPTTGRLSSGRSHSTRS